MCIWLEYKDVIFLNVHDIVPGRFPNLNFLHECTRLPGRVFLEQFMVSNFVWRM